MRICRYIDSMVGDVNRTLLYGGVFGYPSTGENPSGKLRLLYEAAPMSFLVEQTGGASTTGSTRIMVRFDNNPSHHDAISYLNKSSHRIKMIITKSPLDCISLDLYRPMSITYIYMMHHIMSVIYRAITSFFYFSYHSICPRLLTNPIIQYALDY